MRRFIPLTCLYSEYRATASSPSVQLNKKTKTASPGLSKGNTVCLQALINTINTLNLVCLSHENNQVQLLFAPRCEWPTMLFAPGIMCWTISLLGAVTSWSLVVTVRLPVGARQPVGTQEITPKVSAIPKMR